MKSRGLKIFAALAISIGLLPVQAFATLDVAHAEDAPAAIHTQGTRYYGDKLVGNEDFPTAAVFYQALETMDFASGKSIVVNDERVVQQAEAYANGSDALIRSFGAAVDSFKYDHSEIFYVNWDNLTVNVYRKSGKFQVEVGSGRTDSYYLDPALDEGTIRQQIGTYSSAVDSVVANAQGYVQSQNAKGISEAAMKAVCDRVEYSFCESDAEGAKYVQSAYGAAVNGKSVCEGYSRLFKQVMDKLGVQTELVYGNYLDGDNFEAHMWNYVLDPAADNGDGAWYAVDVTACDGHTVGGGTNPENIKKYFWRTSDVFSIDHVEGYVISSVLYEMPYPPLRDLWETPTSSGRFQMAKGIYKGNEETWVSFDGLSAKELLKQRGLYMAMRTATTNQGPLRESPMQSIAEWQRTYYGQNVIDDPAGDKTWICLDNKATAYWEVGIFDIIDNDYYVSDGIQTTDRMYNEDAFMHNLIETVVIDNPNYDPNYIKPAYIDYQLTTPGDLFQKRQDITKPIHCEIVYKEELRLANGTQGVNLTWGVSSYNNRSLTLDAVKKHAKLENVKFQGDKVINGQKRGVVSFDFTPSRQFNHNMIWYNFDVGNVVNIRLDGKDGVQVPKFSLVFAYSGSTACSNVFGDGRLWINTYAQPYLVADSDMSMEGWTFEDGTGISAAQRSQMALVVTSPTNTSETDSAIPQDALSSKTYEIDLNICGKHPVIPNGSYMQMNLGIPDEFAHLVGQGNITFELYHFKRNGDGTLDYNNVERIPCTITKYGIVAKVTSFSPYVLVALDNSTQADVPHNIALTPGAKGGTCKFESGSDSLLPGDSVTYEFTPDAGYEVEYVKLNGVDQTLTGGKLTLSYDDLEANNVLTYGFVSSDVKAAEDADKDLEIVTTPAAFEEGADELVEDPNNPGGDDPGNPGDPSDPGNPGGENPDNPNDPSNPGGDDPSNPGGDDPNDPGTDSPTAAAVPVSGDASEGFMASIAGAPEGSTLELVANVAESGEVVDALKDKLASDFPEAKAVCFDIKLLMDGAETHSGFGKLTISFPVGSMYNGWTSTVYHCHGDSPDNITSQSTGLVSNGVVTATNIEGLSTFLVAVEEIPADIPNDPAPNNPAVPNDQPSNGGSVPSASRPAYGGSYPAYGDVDAASAATTMMEGAHANWPKHSSKFLHFRSGGNFNDFVCVRVDGKTINKAKDYMVWSGSIVVELTPQFLSGLSAGTHSIDIVSRTGTASTLFTVGSNNSTNTSPGSGVKPSVSGGTGYVGTYIPGYNADYSWIYWKNNYASGGVPHMYVPGYKSDYRWLYWKNNDDGSGKISYMYVPGYNADYSWMYWKYNSKYQDYLDWLYGYGVNYGYSTLSNSSSGGGSAATDPVGTSSTGTSPRTNATPTYTVGGDLAKTGDDIPVAALVAGLVAACGAFVAATSFFSGRLARKSSKKE